MVGSVTSIAVSGLQANQQRVQVAANNIANQDTPGFSADQVVQTSQENGGVRTNVVKTTEPPDTAQQLVDTKTAATDFEANIAVIKAQRNLDKHLFDIQA